MNFFRPDLPRWHALALLILLSYPVMASIHLPFGGGARYLSVLAAPTSLLLLLSRPRAEWAVYLRSAFNWSLPFLPVVLTWTLARIWHGYDPLDLTPVSRLLLGALLFMGARIVKVSYRQLAYAAALGALAYGVIAGVEVFAMGRDRAWGGVYENRFGQFAVWLAVLCVLHPWFSKTEFSSVADRAFFSAAFLAGLLAVVLSGSRGALLGLPVAIVVAALHRMTWRRALIYSLGLLALCVMLVLAYEPMRLRSIVAYQEFAGYFRANSFEGTSVGIRLELARVALLTLTIKPWLGVGYTNLPTLYADYAPVLGTMPPPLLSIPSFHSDWFHAIGIGGGVLMTSLLVTVLCMLAAARHNVYRTSFVVCATVFSISELFFLHKMGLTLLITSWALYAAAEDGS